MQRFAIAALRRQLAELSGRNVEDGAIVVLDNASGAPLAWVGANGATSAAAQVDGVLARRQPASTLKPFVYELAFERRLAHAGQPARRFAGADRRRRPVPAAELRPRLQGWVSVRTALVPSLNVPAVRTGDARGPDALFARLNDFGLALAESGGYHGPARCALAAPTSPCSH